MKYFIEGAVGELGITLGEWLAVKHNSFKKVRSMESLTVLKPRRRAKVAGLLVGPGEECLRGGCRTDAGGTGVKPGQERGVIPLVWASGACVTRFFPGGRTGSSSLRKWRLVPKGKAWRKTGGRGRGLRCRQRRGGTPASQNRTSGAQGQSMQGRSGDRE
jgi:hypothetical protein